jgi:tripartite-type tricarboxylate transporter receptor subunit TctC
MKNSIRATISVVLVTFMGLATDAGAQEFPSRTVRLVVPFAPGGGTDVFARLLATRLTEAFGQTVVVDNRAGAGGNIGTEIVVKSPPDGHTLLFVTAAVAINPSLYSKLTFDVRKDLIAITQPGTTSSVLTVHPSVPARNPQEVVALSKRTKGGLNFGSNGAGTSSHLAGVMFMQLGGAQLTHIPYKGAAPAMTALLGGETDVGFPGVNSVIPILRTGKLRALAVTTKKRSSVLPDIPTLDSIYPGIDIDNWFVLFAPLKTPAAVITRVHAEVTKALSGADIRTFMTREGIDPVGSSPTEAAEFIRREVDKFAKVVKAAGIKAE